MVEQRAEKEERSWEAELAAFGRLVVKFILLLVGAMYVYLEFVGVLLYRKRSFKSRLTTHKAGTPTTQSTYVSCIVCGALSPTHGHAQ